MVGVSLTNEQLVARIREGGDGVCYDLEQLWLQNQGMIQTYVKKYKGLAECDDLTQEAYFALCDAVDSYKPGESTFCSYLGVWLSSKLMRYCKSNTGPLRIPERRHSMLYQLRKTESEFEQKFYRKPTRKELRKILGVTGEELNQLFLLDIAMTPASLSSPVKSDTDGEISLGDTIASPENMEEDAVEREFQEQMKRAIHEELRKIPKNQEEAIRLVYLDGLPLYQAGELMGIPRHQVQTLIRNGFRSLRGKPGRRLRPFISEVAESEAYKSSFHRFKNTGFSSTERAVFKELKIF